MGLGKEYDQLIPVPDFQSSISDLLNNQNLSHKLRLNKIAARRPARAVAQFSILIKKQWKCFSLFGIGKPLGHK